MAPRGQGHDSLADIDAHNPFLGNHLGYDDLPMLTGVEPTERSLTVVFADGAAATFHHQWLRHCCYCPECGNPADGIRFSTVLSFDRDVAPREASTAETELRVTWTDGHTSTYGHDWLYLHAYTNDHHDRRRSWRPTLWRSGLSDSFPTVEWTDASDGGEGQLELYRRLRDYGIVRVTGLDHSDDATEGLAALLGPIHETTVYGRMYDVRSEPVAKLGAKTGMAQAPHIDDAFYYSQPGIDVFHCLVQVAKGGESAYVDGFAIAADIAQRAPDAYEALTRLQVTHVRRHPGEIDLRSRSPLIQLDEFARPVGIRYFDRALGPLDVSPHQVDPLYDAVREFNTRMVSDEFTARIRVNAGEGVLIDNHRVMHGRTAFDPSTGRHIRLCHVPRDEFHGRLRELSRRLDPLNHDLILPAGSGSTPAR